jgi:hypothetical protein
MTAQPNVSFAMKTWDEKPDNELPGELKMTRASVAYTYQGDIEGESTLDYLMVYRPITPAVSSDWNASSGGWAADRGALCCSIRARSTRPM